MLRVHNKQASTGAQRICQYIQMESKEDYLFLTYTEMEMSPSVWKENETVKIPKTTEVEEKCTLFFTDLQTVPKMYH